MAGCTGLEPATRGLTVRCSTDWANNPWIAVIVLQDVVLPMGLEPIEKHILSVSCLPIPPQEHIVTVLRTAKRLVRLRGLEPRTCRLKVGYSANWVTSTCCASTTLCSGMQIDYFDVDTLCIKILVGHGGIEPPAKRLWAARSANWANGPYGAESGTRTPDILIKSQLL